MKKNSNFKSSLKNIRKQKLIFHFFFLTFKIHIFFYFCIFLTLPFFCIHGFFKLKYHINQSYIKRRIIKPLITIQNEKNERTFVTFEKSFFDRFYLIFQNIYRFFSKKYSILGKIFHFRHFSFHFRRFSSFLKT